MGVSSGSQKRKAAYDPQRKWGLAPANGSAGPSSSSQVGAEGPTYVVAGHIVAGAAAGKHDMFLKETVGREAQARAARKANSHDTDVALKRLLVRDKEGMRAVQEAREFAKETRKKQRVADGKEVGKEEAEVCGDDDDGESSGTYDEESCESDGALPRPATKNAKTAMKNAYSARVIKELGFDPTSKSFRGGHGQRRDGEEDPRNKKYSEVLSVSSLSNSCAGCSRNVFFLSLCLNS